MCLGFIMYKYKTKQCVKKKHTVKQVIKSTCNDSEMV